MTSDAIERVRAYADLLASGSGALPAVDVAWKLRQILGEQPADAPVSYAAQVTLRGNSRIPPEVALAKRRLTSALIAVSDRLDVPYTDAPEHTPWSRFVKPAMANLDRALRRYFAAVDDEVS